MKKFLVTMVAVFIAMAGYAQTTFNVRVGGGMFQIFDDYYYDEYYYDVCCDDCYGAALTFEANIPLGSRKNKFVFSPSVFMASDFDEGGVLNIPLHFGYKVPIGIGSLFIPKIGPMIGYNVYNESLAFGPSAEFAFEIKHFVFAVNGYVDFMAEAKAGVFGTIGYKF